MDSRRHIGVLSLVLAASLIGGAGEAANRVRDRYCDLVRAPAVARADLIAELRLAPPNADVGPQPWYDLLCVLEISERFDTRPWVRRTEQSVVGLAEERCSDHLAMAVFALVTAKQRGRSVDAGAMKTGLDALHECEGAVWAHRALHAFAADLWPDEVFRRSRSTRRVDPPVASSEWFWRGLHCARSRSEVGVKRSSWSTWRRNTRDHVSVDVSAFDAPPYGPLTLALAEGRRVGPSPGLWQWREAEQTPWRRHRPDETPEVTRRVMHRSLGTMLPPGDDAATAGATALWSLALHQYAVPERGLYADFLDLASDAMTRSGEDLRAVALLVLTAIEVKHANSEIALLPKISEGVSTLSSRLPAVADGDTRAWCLLALAAARAEGFDVDWGLYASELRRVDDDCRYVALANLGDALFGRPLRISQRGRACDVSSVPRDVSWEDWFWQACVAFTSSASERSAWEWAFAEHRVPITAEIERTSDTEIALQEVVHSLFYRYTSVFSGLLSECLVVEDR